MTPPDFQDETPPWTLQEDEGPLIATAIHDGHAVREEVAAHLTLHPEERLREEDPFTGTWAQIVGTHLIARRSRFEMDLNRPRAKAVYRTPEDAWGLTVWKGPLPDGLVRRSMQEYDAFYAEAERLLRRKEEQHGAFVVFDLHSYNHRRAGPDAPPGDPEKNPEIDVGTGTMERTRWAPIVDRFKHDLRAFNFKGRPLDVRENVKFSGGHFARWVHDTFPESGCVLFVEVKKFYMDEWTGAPDWPCIEIIGQALASAVPGVREALAECRRSGETFSARTASHSGS